MKKILSSILALCMILSLCACGSAKSSSYTSYETAATEDAYDYYYAEDSGFAPYEMAESSSESSSSYDTESNGVPEKKSEKIIYSSSVTLETMSFDDTIAGINELIHSYGAYIESSSINGTKLDQLNRGTTSKRTASFVIRVPADKFDPMLNSISTLGNVPSKNVYSDNITNQYYDSEARLKNYQIQEERLLELIGKASDISDIIVLENELADVRYRIESVQTSLRNWDDKVSYSTVNLDVKEVTKYVPAEEEGFISKLGEAFSEGFEMLGNFILGLISIFPIIIFLAVIIVVIIQLVKMFKKKRASRKALKAEKKKQSDAKSDVKVDERESI